MYHCCYTEHDNVELTVTQAATEGRVSTTVSGHFYLLSTLSLCDTVTVQIERGEFLSC